MYGILHRCRPAPPQISAAAAGFFVSFIRRSSHLAAAAVEVGPQPRIERGKWLSLPPFTPPVDAAAIAKEITAQIRVADEAPFTVLKWVRRCCPQLPMSLVQKLFRLRQVRKELTSVSCLETHEQRLKRVSAKNAMVLGDVILLPVTVQKHTLEKCEYSHSEVEVDYIRSLELYKDPAIIVVNKPPGLPVQGGVGIKYSMDALAASSLKYGYSESPRLVHRLDRDSSGILVLGRTQTSATILHSIFREKTSGVLSNNIKDAHRALKKKYWSLVIGTPKHSTGLISVPLVKIVLEDGKSERVTIVKNMNSASSQHALTEYEVIKSSPKGYTWLELRPLTGRKHQLRVHCAEVLGTPIVGDYKYGWQAHRKWEAFLAPEHVNKLRLSGYSHGQKPPFGLDLEGGSISEKRPRLHLHCREMGLPDVSDALQHWQSSSSTRDLSDLDRITVSAPLPAHMQTSWDLLRFVLGIPAGLAPEQAAPLLCAGVTVYSPLNHFGLKGSGLRGAILGLGGVGHMGVKIAKAMGHHVTVISSSDRKRAEAVEDLGADAYLVSSDEAQMGAAVDSLDYIIDTVPAHHPLEPYLSLLKVDGKIILLGVINQPLQFVSPMIMLGRKTITGSFIGSMDETKEMLEFCAEKGVTSMIEMVTMDQVNEALERLERNDVRYRFVVDVAASNLEP